MAKKLVKVEVEEDKLQPNAILLKEGEIMSATCDIYTFNLSKKNKIGQLVSRGLNFDEDYEETDLYDFCLLRVKDSLIERLEKKEITIFYRSNSDSFWTEDVEEITSLDELVSCIDDYITSNDGELLFKRVNKKDRVYFIPYLDCII